jgi:hypothetical protein
LAKNGADSKCPTLTDVTLWIKNFNRFGCKTFIYYQWVTFCFKIGIFASILISGNYLFYRFVVLLPKSGHFANLLLIEIF